VLDLVPYRLSPELRKEIHAFAPEVIYSCIGNIQLASLVKELARREGAVTAVHLLDDWLGANHPNFRMWPWYRRKLSKVSHDLIYRSAACMAASYILAEEYAATFDVPFQPFMHCLPVSAEQPPAEDPAPFNALRLVYVGGLHLNRWRSLLEIAGALEELQREGVHAKLHIYAPAKDLEEHGVRLAESVIEIGGSLGPEEVSGVLPGAHVLVHVEAFDTDSRAYARLSLSTKITQYLAAGRPLFCYGPGEVGSCRYVESTGAGIVVGRQDRSELVNKLRLLCLDRDLRLKLGQTAWETARTHHDAEAVRERFRTVLADAAARCRASPTEALGSTQAPGQIR
jgi:glycosyltransferase involved in cell wall biosynthesis